MGKNKTICKFQLNQTLTKVIQTCIFSEMLFSLKNCNIFSVYTTACLWGEGFTDAAV